MKIKLKFKQDKNCLKASGFENKIIHLNNNKTDVKKNQKEFIANNKIILKSEQSERYNVFTEEIDKIALSSSDDKRIQSIVSIESYAYRTKKIYYVNKA